MKILLVHSYYQQRGGEDHVFERESDLLSAAGHQVEHFTRHNDEIADLPAASVAGTTLWSRGSYRSLRATLRRFQPDLLHAHNTFPLISPAAYHAAAAEAVPVVQTLHNFRLRCANGLFLRDGQVCTRCLEQPFAWPAIAHRCYRGNRGASAVTVGMQTLHRGLGTWRSRVDRYIALSNASKALLERGGLPSERIAVKGNFLADPGFPNPDTPRAGALFVGRLSQEKGVESLIEAWPDQTTELSVIGDGDLGPALRARAPERVRFRGPQPREAVFAAMRQAAFLVLPSICYENFPLVICEAYACGLPVITTRHGAMQELVSEGVTGLLFTPGQAEDLKRQVDWATQHPEEMREMGRTARRIYEERFTPDANYRELKTIYDAVLARRA